MKYKTLFRLALKVIGVYFVALGIIELGWFSRIVLDWIAPIYSFSSQPNLNRTSKLINEVISLFTPLCKFGVGLYLFIGGEWIVNKAIPSNKPYCHECGYMLKNLTGTRCPECDTPFRPEPPATPPATS